MEIIIMFAKERIIRGIAIDYEEAMKKEKNWKTHLVIIPEDVHWEDGFKDPTNFFLTNAFLERYYFKTRSRAKAQEWANMLYGNNFYLVRPVVKAITR